MQIAVELNTNNWFEQSSAMRELQTEPKYKKTEKVCAGTRLALKRFVFPSLTSKTRRAVEN